MSDCYLSVVIPAYNEERRLPETLDTLRAYLAPKAYPWEIVVADDGSEDATAAIVSLVGQTDDRIKILPLPHRGKGWAVKNGMLAARGEYRFLCDADLSMPIGLLDRLLPGGGASSDIVIGSREAPGARRIGEPRRRWLMGRVFNAMTRVLATPGIADTQCGFKVFRAAAAETLFALQTLDGFAFDAEILFLARRRGFGVAEVGIDWYYRPESKVRPIRDGWRTLRDLVIIRCRWFSGFYER
jgi:glycosyltransferase involved in cell wall biosynthesis